MSTPTIGGGAEAAVLQDLTGRRARWLRRGGGVVFVAFLAWLIAIVLGGVGLAPVPGIPFGRALRPTGPPPLVRLPTPTQPSAADLRPALPDAALAQPISPTGQSKKAPARSPRALAPGQTQTTTPGTAPGRSATAPGHTRAAPPGQTRTTPPGQTRTTPPGQTRTTPPGQTRTARDETRTTPRAETTPARKT
jgi:hypothetical protein